MLKDTSTISDRCPRCGKGPMVTDNPGGEMFCGSCGFVVTERIEELGPEWRAFSKEEHEDRSRAGIPTSLAMHDMGLATIIGPVDKDASGKPLTAAMTGVFKFSIRLVNFWPRLENSRADPEFISYISLMSAPAMNALFPHPVRITTLHFLFFSIHDM